MADNGQFDFTALAQRAQQMQGELAQVKDGLAALQAVGYGGGGLVVATVSSEGRLVDLRIDTSVIDPDDPETLSGMVIAATDDAHRSLAEQRAEHLATVTDGVNGLLAGLRETADNLGDGVVPRFPNRPAPNRPAAPRNPERSAQ